MGEMNPRTLAVLVLGGFLAASAAVPAPPPQPSLRSVFPAGGRRGSTQEATAHGTDLANVVSARVSGGGVTVEVVPPPAGQPSNALAARLRLTIASDAALGERDLRLATRSGVTNRARFLIGELPEIVEVEPNSDLKQPQRVTALPVVINGQIDTAEDMDHFLVTVQAGETLTFDICGQRLAPAIGNIRPGWFETCLTLYDAGGKELKFVDDHYSRPDALITYTFLRTGEYVIQVRDLLFRGHPQFAYRLEIRRTSDRQPAVSEGLPTSTEDATNDAAATAPGRPPVGVGPQPLSALPADIVGRIERDGDAASFCFAAQAGQRLVFEVSARRADSPLDSVLELLNSQGRVLASNDDTAGAGTDSRLEFTFASTDTHTVRIRDRVGRGGKEYTYRLTVRPPVPDFELEVTPDNPPVGAGETVALTVSINRKEGFAGEVSLSVSGLPAGVTASPATIPADQKQARLTITAPENTPPGLSVLTLTGTATVGGQTVIRQAVGIESVRYVDQPRRLPVREVVLAIVGKAE